MEFTVLHFLWILPLCALTNQEMVHLTLTPRVSTNCGAEVTLHCNVSSSRHGLSIKHLEWAHSGISLCSVKREGNISYNTRTTSDFRCEYEGGRLSLVLNDVQPEKDSRLSQRYTCKLHSNMGAPHNYTTVEIEECGKIEHASMTSDGPTCTFSGVHLGGDVHWFTGPSDVPDDVANQRTTINKETGGWLTIRSYLLGTEGSDGPYNCSLRSSESGRYIASALIRKNEVEEKTGHSLSTHSGAQSQGFLWSVVCVSVLLAVTPK